MEAPFYHGQKMVCIKTVAPYIYKENIYVCDECIKCHGCGHWFVTIVGIENTSIMFTCHKCYSIILNCKKDYKGASASNFAPIEDQYADITADIAAGVTETKEQPDKVIIPLKPEAAPCGNTFS